MHRHKPYGQKRIILETFSVALICVRNRNANYTKLLFSSFSCPLLSTQMPKFSFQDQVNIKIELSDLKNLNNNNIHIIIYEMWPST